MSSFIEKAKNINNSFKSIKVTQIDKAILGTKDSTGGITIPISGYTMEP